MKKFLLIVLALFMVSVVESQTQDTTKHKKKHIIIDDTWQTPKKSPKKKTGNQKNKISHTTRSKSLTTADTVITKPNKTTITDEWRSSKNNTYDNNSVSYTNSCNNYIPRFNGHWSGVDVGFNTFVDADYSMYDSKYDGFMEVDQSRSISISLNFMECNIGLQRKNNMIGLVTGFGLEWNRYQFDNKFTIAKDELGIIQPVQNEAQWKVKRASLSTLYLNMPLLLEFQMGRKGYWSRAHIDLGVVAGLRLYSSTRTKFKSDDGTRRKTNKDRFSLNNFRYSAMLRVGYGSLNLYATYGITKLFEKNKGPKLTPITVGVTLIGF